MSVVAVRTPGQRLNATIAEACQALRISRWTLYREIKEGKLKAIKIRATVLIPLEELDRYQQALVDEAAQLDEAV